MAGVLGIEPRVVVLETTGLPLTDTPIMSENTLRQKQLISLTLFFCNLCCLEDKQRIQ